MQLLCVLSSPPASHLLPSWFECFGWTEGDSFAYISSKGHLICRFVPLFWWAGNMIHARLEKETDITRYIRIVVTKTQFSMQKFLTPSLFSSIRRTQWYRHRSERSSCFARILCARYGRMEQLDNKSGTSQCHLERKSTVCTSRIRFCIVFASRADRETSPVLEE